MRIGIPVWEDRISPVLDTTSRMLLIGLDSRGEIWRGEIHLGNQGLSQRCSSIEKAGVDILICGAVSKSFSEILLASGINLISGISGYAEEVLRAYQQGTLTHPKFLMPGCKRRRLQHCPGLGGLGKRVKKTQKKEMKSAGGG